MARPGDDTAGIEVVLSGDLHGVIVALSVAGHRRLSVDEARALALRLNAAADLAEQFRAAESTPVLRSVP